jgi:hypothetical protein
MKNHITHVSAGSAKYVQPIERLSIFPLKRWKFRDYKGMLTLSPHEASADRSRLENIREASGLE